MGPIPPEIMYFLCIVTCFDVSAMYLKCISSVVFGAFGRLVSLCIVYVSSVHRLMYRSCAWCPRLCYYIDTCGGIDFLQYWTIQCRIQVSYMYQMIHLIRRDLPTHSSRLLPVCGDTWIMYGSHNTRPTCGIRPKYILLHDQIHVSVRGVSSPNWGGIMTIPRPGYDVEKDMTASPLDCEF